MIIRMYELSKMYYLEKITKQDVINEMVDKYSMNAGSINHYVEAYCQLRKGEKYTRTINKTAVELYLERIYKEEGKDKLKIALKSLLESLEYYESLNHGNLPSIRKIIKKYSEI